MRIFFDVPHPELFILSLSKDEGRGMRDFSAFLILRQAQDEALFSMFLTLSLSKGEG
jgi:hypothetical protein